MKEVRKMKREKSPRACLISICNIKMASQLKTTTWTKPWISKNSQTKRRSTFKTQSLIRTELTPILKIHKSTKRQGRDSRTENQLSEADKGRRTIKRSLSKKYQNKMMSLRRSYKRKTNSKIKMID